ncbi:hypothetical protein ACFPYI_12650 [Halomarina salina]|uniref:Polymer-forming cytoskeletal protein n=1 Tax=Halomarina salina TaxID=1872699 RepID=A0ABD5RP84_9EURY|nr:hypothetical protein [Halomarina salina]
MTELDRGERVSVDGIGSFDDVDCETFDVDGTCSVAGDVLADRVLVDGATDVGGRVDARELDADGSLTVAGVVHVDVVHLDGATEVGGNLDVHEVDGDGATEIAGSLVASGARFDGTVAVGGLTDVTTLTVDGVGRFDDVNADAFTVDGALHAGDVAADSFEFDVHDDSTAETVSGAEIRVRRGDHDPSLLARFVGSDDGTFTVGTVEGGTVALDATDAETVVGEHVTLGPDADVAVVYTDDLDADPAASVGEVRSFDAYGG